MEWSWNGAERVPLTTVGCVCGGRLGETRGVGVGVGCRSWCSDLRPGLFTQITAKGIVTVLPEPIPIGAFGVEENSELLVESVGERLEDASLAHTEFLSRQVKIFFDVLLFFFAHFLFFF